MCPELLVEPDDSDTGVNRSGNPLWFQLLDGVLAGFAWDDLELKNASISQEQGSIIIRTAK